MHVLPAMRRRGARGASVLRLVRRAAPVRRRAIRRSEVTRLYLGIQTSDGDPPGPVLRVSRYLEAHEFSAPEGTITVPGDHARISIWHIDRPVAAISLTGSDAEELGRFLSDPAPSAWPREDSEQDLST